MAFRTSKTVHLEMRPMYVRTEEHTRGHVLVVMLAYLIRRELSRAWAGVERDGGRGAGAVGHAVLDGGQGRRRRAVACASRRRVDGSAALLKAASVRVPEVLPHLATRVVTRHSLPSRRQLPCATGLAPASGWPDRGEHPLEPGVGGVERDGGRGAGAVGHPVLDGGQGGGRRQLPEDPGAASCLGGPAQSGLGSHARSTTPSGDSCSHAPLTAVTTTTPLMPPD